MVSHNEPLFGRKDLFQAGRRDRELVSLRKIRAKGGREVEYK